MFRANNILAIFVGLNGLCHGRPSTVQDLAVRSRIEYSDISIRDIHILDAFVAAGTGPVQEWMDGSNQTYQSLYVIDTADWDAMHHNCLENAYTRRLEEALPHFPKEHHDQLHKDKRENLREAIRDVSEPLVARDSLDDAKQWLCNTDGPLQYKFPLSILIGDACTFFLHYAGYLGKKQIIQRSTLRDVANPLEDRYGKKLVTTISWVFYVVETSGAAVCSTVFSEGITKLCSVVISGNKGTSEGSQGLKEYTHKDSKGKTLASGSWSSSEL